MKLANSCVPNAPVTTLLLGVPWQGSIKTSYELSVEAFSISVAWLGVAASIPEPGPPFPVYRLIRPEPVGSVNSRPLSRSSSK